MIITAIKQQKRKKNRYSIFIDGEYSFPASDEIVARLRLKEGADVDEDEIRRVIGEEQRRQALDDSFRMLALRAHSRKELGEKLARKSFSAEVITATLERLQELGYINDRNFAAQRLNTLRSQGKGREWIKADLKDKGMDSETVADVLAKQEFSPQDELAAARALADKKWPQLAGVPAQAAVRRLAGFLSRRGFSTEAIAGALRHIRHKTSEGDE